MTYCICVNPSGDIGCPLCNPGIWTRIETEEYTMWVQKRSDPYMYYI